MSNRFPEFFLPRKYPKSRAAYYHLSYLKLKRTSSSSTAKALHTAVSSLLHTIKRGRPDDHPVQHCKEFSKEVAHKNICETLLDCHSIDLTLLANATGRVIADMGDQLQHFDDPCAYIPDLTYTFHFLLHLTSKELTKRLLEG
ncbi:hypothetical protein DICVIV_13914 [Dictyocaulus viviparus]|uniref:Uncharacterized protein n=1 Tax=Dictyocaulus viviparus TaxID=29172 RepID=A0A0D8X8R1_DICVI|nr:hypothetical protein DICVIV_13914 [Dictyocaulus viviparus]